MREIFERYKSVLLEYEILLWESEPVAYRLKARLRFIDGSELSIKDYLFPTGRKYAYHWRDKDGFTLARWDNAAHWKGISTFPHHKHVGDQLVASRETTIETTSPIHPLFKELKMPTVTLEQAGENLRGIIQRAIRDKEETIIASDEGAVVVLAEHEWENIKETLRLLSDKESLAALLASHAVRDQGGRPDGITPDEAFRDV